MTTGEPFSDKLRFVYLQLPCFDKSVDDCKSDFERWIYVLKNMETLNRLPWAAQNSVFQRLAEIAEVSAMTKEERIEYDGALKKYRDMLNTLRGAELRGEAKGRAEGLAEGLAEGEQKKALSVARKMKQRGMAVAEIAELTDLTEEELARL